ncbi:MAG TPA: DUF3618 domain-containing protein [Micromonosporaceae bacterium]|nr:DUF3618 domain-containing protein [Micromonosporaceae bacterium]
MTMENVAPSDPDAIRADIDQARVALGDSLEALAAKADLPARVRRHPAPVVGVVAGVVAVVVAVLMIKRWRAR